MGSKLFTFVLIRPLLYITTPALQYTTPANWCIVLPSQTRTCVSGAMNERMSRGSLLHVATARLATAAHLAGPPQNNTN